ncbi:hypothetical protein Hypma_002390 [Hypsizygus marmoreus]|uniref:Uncharacterized protein n=1 Tax=Hypsizygus marmoreus TaxID=39966 RepID=A0A369J6A4_HYPMA|nr:hypothetical protein Hypma_002390 [Hypsizygus marmoreus]
MPALHQSLRERCNIQLKVETAIPTSVDFDTPLYDDEVFTRGRTRTRKPIPDVRVPYAKQKKTDPAVASMLTVGPKLYPVGPAISKDLRSLHELVPYVYVSLHEGMHLPCALVARDGTAFTHIVKITHETEKRPAGAVQLMVAPEQGLYTLVLAVPVPDTSDASKKGERTCTILTEYQLLMACDFLALALPYYSAAHPRDDIPVASADRVRVLISAPVGAGASADVMSVAVCYLSFASEEPAETVLGYIKAEEEVLRVWREAVGEGAGGVEFVERVARMGN